MIIINIIYYLCWTLRGNMLRDFLLHTRRQRRRRRPITWPHPHQTHHLPATKRCPNKPPRPSTTGGRLQFAPNRTQSTSNHRSSRTRPHISARLCSACSRPHQKHTRCDQHTGTTYKISHDDRFRLDKRGFAYLCKHVRVSWLADCVPNNRDGHINNLQNLPSIF